MLLFVLLLLDVLCLGRLWEESISGASSRLEPRKISIAFTRDVSCVLELERDRLVFFFFVLLVLREALITCLLSLGSLDIVGSEMDGRGKCGAFSVMSRLAWLGNLCALPLNVDEDGRLNAG